MSMHQPPHLEYAVPYQAPEPDPVPDFEFTSLDFHTDNRPADWGDPFELLAQKEEATGYNAVGHRIEPDRRKTTVILPNGITVVFFD